MNIAHDWDDIRFFLEVTRLGTLSKAAERLGVDHTTVSRRIDRLEKSLKARLFVRGVKGFQPTAEALRLLSTAEAMETAAIIGRASVNDKELSPTVVRIGAPDGFGSIYLAPRLPAICRSRTNLHIELIATARNFSLTKREADIAFSLTRPTQGRIVARKLTEYSLFIYGSVDYLKRHKLIGDVKELRHHSFISYIDDLLFTPELNYLVAISKNIVAPFKSANLIAQLQACLSGAGLAVLPAFLAHGYPSLKPVLRERVHLTRTFYMQMHEDSRKVRLIQDVADFISDQVRSDKALFKPVF